MSDVVIVDTSVLLNLLKIPGHSNASRQVEQEFRELLKSDARLLLPYTVVFEAGRRIAHLSDGGYRRRYAELFCQVVRESLRGDAPWAFVPLPEREEIAEWLDDFPDRAQQEISLADLSLIEFWNTRCELHPKTRVRIWARDKHLRGYDTKP